MKKIIAPLLIVICLFSNYALAENISVENIKQTKTQIKSLQKQGNYFAADKLINALIKQDSDNPAFYFDLALNYFYNNQPIQAEQTLLYVLNNKDLSNVPEKVIKNINIFYEKVKMSADKKRKIQSNTSTLNINVGLDSGFNTNNNKVPDNESGLNVINEYIESYEMRGLDPSLVGLDNEKEFALKNSINMSVDYYPKKIRLLNQDFQINHYIYATVEGESVIDKDFVVGSNANYKIEPKFFTDSNVITSHKYPMSINYYSSNEVAVLTMSVNPVIEIFKYNQIGYTFNVNQQYYNQYNIEIDPNDSNLSYYQIEPTTDSVLSHSAYYRFSKRFKIKFTPALSSKFRITSVSGASEYTRMEAWMSANIILMKRIKWLQSYEIKLTDYAISSSTFIGRSDVEHKLQSKLTYKLNKNINLAAEYQFKLRTSNEQQYQYKQSELLLSLDWSR